jgi:sugar/nucleoside kinase (ribokinase family)
MEYLNRDGRLKFVALGGIWLDEICSPGKETLFDVPGGSVAFGKISMVSCRPMLDPANHMSPAATFGALLCSRETPKSIGLFVRAGYDFPLTLERILKQWNVDLHMIRESTKPSSRGRIIYGQSPSDRKYLRLTQPLPSTAEDLAATNMISAACFHLFDIPATVQDQIDQIMALRTQQFINYRPMYVWEPQAKTCSPETFEHHKSVVEQVDIFSPNHAELASFFTQRSMDAVLFNAETVERQARAFMPSSSPHPICILIRCAEHGCFVLSTSPDGEISAWLPAYHTPGSAGVVDSTGAGNAFLGGAAMGYLRHEDFVTAAAYGCVAASFAVEVFGLPEIRECDAKQRLVEYMSRLRDVEQGLDAQGKYGGCST